MPGHDKNRFTDIISKTLYVLRYYPKYLFGKPALLKDNITKLFQYGPHASMQFAYDYVKLRKSRDKFISSEERLKKNTTSYDEHVKKTLLTEEEIMLKKNAVKEWSHRPKISILMPLYKIEPQIFMEAVESIKNQIYENWELCITNTSGQAEINEHVTREAKRDNRIKTSGQTFNDGIAVNTNASLAIAGGEFVAFLDADDLLEPDALWEVAKTINGQKDVDIIYSDEDKIDHRGSYYYDAFFKPDWSPALLLSMNYICHLTVVRKKLIDALGGLRPEFDGAQDYDFILRATELTSKILHIPKILYHWRATPNSTALFTINKPESAEKRRLAASEALKRRDLIGAADIAKDNLLKINYGIKDKPLVSIIMPTKDKVEMTKACMQGLLEKTDYNNFEIIIIDNNSKKRETKKYLNNLKEQKIARLIDYPHKFNYSAINNIAAEQANGEYLLFLNNDIEIINDAWLREMLMWAQLKDIGAVGAKLYYPNNKIQHAGVIIYNENYGPAHAFWNRSDKEDYFNFLNTVREYSAVTAACMLMSKEVFEEAGGFDESFPAAYNDVDLCLKVRQKGYRVLYTPYAKLYHLESATRGFDIEPEAKDRLYKKWKDFIGSSDPYYNPNFSAKPDQTFTWRGF